jgi:hypothetical protein
MSQLAGARFIFRRDAAQFVRDLERPVDFVLRRVVGALRPLRQIAGALEPKRQLVLDPMREYCSRSGIP